MRLISKSSSVILCFFFFLFCLLSFDVLRAEDVIEGKEDGEDVNEETESNNDEKDSDQEEEEIEETNNKDEDEDEGDEDEKDDEDKEEKGEDEEEVDAPATDDDNKEEGDEDEKDEDKEEKGEDEEEVDAPATDDDNKEEGDEDEKDEDKEEKGEDEEEVDAPATDDDNNKEEGDEDENDDEGKEVKGDDDADIKEKGAEGEKDEDREEKGEDDEKGDADKKEKDDEKDDNKEEGGDGGDDKETVQPESEGLQDTTTEEKEGKEEKMETVLTTGHGSENEAGEANEEDKSETEPDKEGDWSYRGRNGPGNWSKSFSDCRSGDERLQSPININSDQSTFTADDQSLDAIELTANDGTNTTIAHKDHTVKLSFDKIIRVNGLGKTVKVKEAQFRWGETETTGSEHSIDGKRYPLEMQIFAFDEDDFASFEDAIEADSGGNVSSSSRFIVLATLFELSTADNPSLTEITKNLESIQNPGGSVVVDSFDLKDLLPEMTDYYFRYAGSLTFPPCVERGDWIVFRQRQTVSLAQLEKFRHLYEERSSDDDETNTARIAFNYRPVQPLNGRIVTRTFPVEAVPPVGKEPTVGKEEASVDEEEDQVDPKPPASAIGNGNAADAVKIQASVSLAFPLLALLWKVIR